MAGIEVLGDILAAHEAARPDKPALVFEGRTTSYAALARYCNQVGRALAAEGIGKGTRVAQIGRNSDVKAIVVKKPGASFTAEELIAYARTRIAGYKVPKSVDFAETLPRNPSGKILERELREPYWRGQERQVH